MLKRYLLSLPTSTHKKIKRLSARNRVTMNETILRLIDKGLKASTKK